MTRSLPSHLALLDLSVKKNSLAGRKPAGAFYPVAIPLTRSRRLHFCHYLGIGLGWIGFEPKYRILRARLALSRRRRRLRRGGDALLPLPLLLAPDRGR